MASQTWSGSLTNFLCLFSFQIAWIKVKTQTILTMDERVVTRNPRISVDKREGNLWQLTIRAVKPSDQGFYMCQINTDPMISEKGYLEVTGKYFCAQIFFVILSSES